MIEPCPSGSRWLFLTVIVERGGGSKWLKEARSLGIGGGTVLLGQGTIGTRQTGRLDALSERKEIIGLIASEVQAARFIRTMQQARLLVQPRRCVALSIPVIALTGSSVCQMTPKQNPIGGKSFMKQAIWVVVDKGEAERVVEAAEKAGALGATVINARGAGKHETSQLFAMAIEPEKEMVLLVVDQAVAGQVLDRICQDCQINEPGRGIAFTVNVEQYRGQTDG
ncbi:MAG: P-II family nitrogen regulator [Clostridia bacterium]|nr:P-II family nitrogen regulator [Clostridia bacterium]